MRLARICECLCVCTLAHLSNLSCIKVVMRESGFELSQAIMSQVRQSHRNPLLILLPLLQSTMQIYGTMLSRGVPGRGGSYPSPIFGDLCTVKHPLTPPVGQSI